MMRNNISIEFISKFVFWDKHILDIVCPINKAGAVYFHSDISNFSSDISIIDQFELEYNRSTEQKKKELLFSSLSYHKKELEKFKDKPELPSEIDIELYDGQSNYAYQLLIHKIYTLYSNGYNPKLSEFKHEIMIALDAELKSFQNSLKLISRFILDKSEKDIAIDIISSKVYERFELVIQTVDFIKYLQEKCLVFDIGSEIIADSNRKLVWKGTPAHFALIIDLLIERGYLEPPTQFATRNARILLQYFEFKDGSKPTDDSLGNILHKDMFPIKNKAHIDKFYAIPKRNELDK
jgi:hypothetical protein